MSEPSAKKGVRIVLRAMRTIGKGTAEKLANIGGNSVSGSSGAMKLRLGCVV